MAGSGADNYSNKTRRRTVPSQREKREKRTVSARQWAATRDDSERTAFRIPKDTTLFYIKVKGKKKLDFIPYVVGKGNPMADEGSLWFERTFWIHSNIGINEKSYVCPARSAGRRCPICEERARQARNPDAAKELIKALEPKQRQLFQVIDLSEPDKGVQLWEISYHLFGKSLKERINNADEDRGWDRFADLTEGMTVEVVFVDKAIPGYSAFFDCSSIDFLPRAKPYNDGMLDRVACLDDLLIIRDYEELKKIFLQETEEEGDKDEERPTHRPGSADPAQTRPNPAKTAAPPAKQHPSEEELWDDEEPEKPAAPARAKTAPQPANTPPKAATKAPSASADGLGVGSVVYHAEFGKCEIVKVSGDGTSLTLEDAEEEFHKAVARAEVTLTPPTKTHAPAAESVVDDDWDAEWDK
jgi:hypothetical protein